MTGPYGCNSIPASVSTRMAHCCADVSQLTSIVSPAGASVYQLGSFGTARKELKALALTP